MEPSESRVFGMNLTGRAYEAIKAHRKTVEVRANKINSPIHSMNVGDVILFTKYGTNQTQSCTITRITLYPCVRTLLLKEGVEKTLSTGLDLEAGIKSIESIPDYATIIQERGVFAIGIKVED